MKAMRVHRFGPPESMCWDEVETPTPAPGEALVRVRATGVNRADVDMRSGIYGNVPMEELYLYEGMTFPFTPGIEPVGTVESIGEGGLGVSGGVSVGDRVIPHSHLSCGKCRNCLLGFDNACPQLRILGVQTGEKGGYAEYFTWPVELLIPLPDSLSFEAAASLLVNYGPVWTALVERTNLRPGETLVVTGASGDAAMPPSRSG